MPDAPVPAKPRLEILLAFGAVYVLWGSTYLAIRIGVETIPPFVLAGLRHLTAGVVLYAWVRGTKRAARPETRHWRSAALVGGLLLLGGNGLVTWAEQRVPSGLAALIVASVPLWMTVLDAVLSRRRPHGVVLAGLALGLGGIAFLAAPGRFGGGRIDPLGAAALLTAALLWATGSLVSRRVALPSSTLLATAMEMVAGGVILLAVAGLTGELAAVSLSAVSARSLFALGYLVVAGSLLGFSAYIFLLGATTPARVSTYAYVNPIVAVFLGWLVAGEAVTARTLIAAAVIVASVALIIRHGAERPAAPREEEPVPLRAQGGRR
jgi:drug/metabolite transporter (DMT)-like permease